MIHTVELIPVLYLIAELELVNMWNYLQKENWQIIIRCQERHLSFLAQGFLSRALFLLSVWHHKGIVRIEFSPLVEIGVNKGHYWPADQCWGLCILETDHKQGLMTVLKLVMYCLRLTWSKQNRKTLLIVMT